MFWESIDTDSQEESTTPSLVETKESKDLIHNQNEQKRLFQLRKLSNHKHEEKKRSYIAQINKLGELLTSNKIEEIANDFMTEDCEVILFNFAEMLPVNYVCNQLGFTRLLKDYKVTQREVKETYVDLEKTTIIQYCLCEIMNEKEDTFMMQYSCEMFSFEKDRVRQYRALYGCMALPHEPEKLFIPSQKEKMIAKVKELNQAWADQPDLEKVASLLHESTEYKVWSWKDRKCLILNKNNFALEYRKSIEEDFVIKSIIPFEPSCEAQFIVGSYVYYLEGKGELEGRKYQWINTCIYAFDRDLNIAKINQQGELYPEDEVLIPFEVYQKEKIKQKIDAFYTIINKPNCSLFGNPDFNFSFEICNFGSSQSPCTGIIKGFSEYKKLLKALAYKIGDFELTKPIDMYQDLDDPVYDTAITFDCTKGVLERKDSLGQRQTVNVYAVRKFSFENGKLAKVIVFAFGIMESNP